VNETVRTFRILAESVGDGLSRRRDETLAARAQAVRKHTPKICGQVFTFPCGSAGQTESAVLLEKPARQPPVLLWELSERDGITPLVPE